MSKTVLIPTGSAPPLAPYSPGTKAGGTIYVSGMVALDAQGRTVGIGDARVQTRAVLESIKAVVEQGGGTMADIAFNSIFLRDYADYKAMNEVYAEYFPENPPARDSIQAPLVPDTLLVEIASIAHLGK